MNQRFGFVGVEQAGGGGVGHFEGMGFVPGLDGGGLFGAESVSYTHLTLPTNREV